MEKKQVGHVRSSGNAKSPKRNIMNHGSPVQYGKLSTSKNTKSKGSPTSQKILKNLNVNKYGGQMISGGAQTSQGLYVNQQIRLNKGGPQIPNMKYASNLNVSAGGGSLEPSPQGGVLSVGNQHSGGGSYQGSPGCQMHVMNQGFGQLYQYQINQGQYQNKIGHMSAMKQNMGSQSPIINIQKPIFANATKIMDQAQKSTQSELSAEEQHQILQEKQQKLIYKKQNSIKSSGTVFVKENTGFIKDFYKISSCIGRGAYGEVRKCLHKETKALRAVKILNKKCLPKEEIEKLVNEIDILKQLDHPNILKLYEFFQDQKRYFLVTEHCNGGELFDKISEEQCFGEKEAAKIVKQILSAVNYCHQRKIVHRDLKPENILMNRDLNDPKITIIDFGTSGFFDPEKKMDQKFGTPYYIAPEVLNNNYDEKCDLWSVGVILYILLCGYPPFNGANDDQIIKRVEDGKYQIDEEEWQNISKDGIDLVKKLLAYNPKERISAEDALQHKWIIEQSTILIDVEKARKTLDNLRNFSGTSKLKQAALAFIASHLTKDEEKRDLDKIFKAIDINGDGNLSKEEVMLGYEQHLGIPMTVEQVDEMFEKIDLDGNGTIDYTEFVTATIEEKNLVTIDRLKMAFKMFDKDGSGALSPDEIKDVLCFDSSVDPSEIDKIIAEVDENGDGEIQFDEFCHMMQRFADDKQQ